MARNVEIKARVHDFVKLAALAESLADSPRQVLTQEDTFFNVPTGRLKLRVLGFGRGELIHYQRSDVAGPKQCEYTIFRTDDSECLKLALSRALGVRAVVRKQRWLYLVGQTRIHLDRVEELGDFVELEVVLTADQSVASGQAIAEDLAEQLQIAPVDLIESAYVNLLADRDRRGAGSVWPPNTVNQSRHR